MKVHQGEIHTIHVPFETLERALIDEFVRASGHDPGRLSELRPHERETLLAAACLHASVKMAEIEARSHFVDDMRADQPGRKGL